MVSASNANLFGAHTTDFNTALSLLYKFYVNRVPVPQKGLSGLHFVPFIDFYVIPSPGFVPQGGRGHNKGVGNSSFLSIIHFC